MARPNPNTAPGQERFCPFCDKRLDAATGIHTRKEPEPGDLSVCLHCGGLAVFEEQSFRVCSLDEFNALPAMTAFYILEAQNAVFERIDRGKTKK